MQTFRTFILILLAIFSRWAWSGDQLERCDSPSQVHSFTTELEDIAVEGATPLILFNSNGQAVGVISATPSRAKDYPYLTTSVRMNKISLCSKAPVTEFFYTKGDDHLLLTWGTKTNRELRVFQDEGLLLLTTKVEINQDQPSKVTLNFSIYDVYESESQKPKLVNSLTPPSSLDEWGSPRASGTMYFFTPSNWKWPKK